MLFWACPGSPKQRCPARPLLMLWPHSARWLPCLPVAERLAGPLPLLLEQTAGLPQHAQPPGRSALRLVRWCSLPAWHACCCASLQLAAALQPDQRLVLWLAVYLSALHACPCPFSQAGQPAWPLLYWDMLASVRVAPQRCPRLKALAWQAGPCPFSQADRPAWALLYRVRLGLVLPDWGLLLPVCVACFCSAC